MTAFFELAKKGAEAIRKKPRTCEICGVKETVGNIVIKYDIGKMMCDDCAIDFYEKKAGTYEKM